jgi:Selenocysteine synthase [seryl-tRNASer selenium transferase]
MGESISFKNIPSITECDKFLMKQKLPHGKQVREYVNSILNKVRQEISKDSVGKLSLDNSEIMERVADEVRIRSNGIKSVINATGVVVHTNLGRAPISKDLIMKALPKLCS